jgi:hypothetical protein
VALNNNTNALKNMSATIRSKNKKTEKKADSVTQSMAKAKGAAVSGVKREKLTPLDIRVSPDSRDKTLRSAVKSGGILRVESAAGPGKAAPKPAEQSPKIEAKKKPAGRRFGFQC